MSKKAFLNKLKKELSSLPRSEREKTIAYYDELIEDRKESGATEEAAVYAMGDVHAIAAEILADAKERGVELKKSGMPTFLKVILIAFAALFLIAATAFGVEILREVKLAGVAPEWEKVQEDLEVGSIDSINIDMSSCDLFIGRSQDEKIHFTYYLNENLVRFSFVKTEKSVTLTQRQKGLLYGFLPMRHRRSVSVLVPDSFTGSINSKTETGETNLDSVTNATALNLSTSTGGLHLLGVRAKYALLRNTTGDLTVTECVFTGDLTATGTTGSAKLRDTTAFQLKIERSTGGVTLTNVLVTTKLEVGVSTGDITINSAGAETAFLHSSTGDIGFEQLSAKEIEITVSTGDVRGTLAGREEDYTFETHTSTGKNNLPESFGHGERKLKIKTSTGDIKVEFAG